MHITDGHNYFGARLWYKLTCQGRQRGWCGGTPSLALAVVSHVQSRPPETAPHMDGAGGSVTRTPL